MKKILASALVVAATLTLSVQTAAAAEPATKNSEGTIEFKPSTAITPPVNPLDPDPNNPVSPVDPLDPTKPLEPGTVGPLSIDFASSLYFGNNEITNKDMTYYANAQKLSDDTYVPNYVQISDNRGSNAGWTLSVKQNGQFKNDGTKNAVLTGAKLTFEKGNTASNQTNVVAPTTSAIELAPEGDAVTVMAAKVNEGTGTWVSSYGTVEAVTENEETVQKTKAIALSVPGSTPKDAVQYSTTLTWTLSDVPAN